MSGVAALLSTELRRFFSRRVMRGAFAFGIALSTLVLVIITVRSQTRIVTENRTQLVCSQTPGAPATVPAQGQFPPGCNLQTTVASVPHDARIKIHDNLSGTIRGTGVAMVMLAFVIGASFIGAEFGAGSLGTQLIFEPRRVRVVVVKAVAVGVGLAVLATALLLYIALLQWAGSALRGVVHGLDGQWFAARAGDVGRVAAAVALAGMAAFAVTVVARRTVAAVAGLLVLGYVSAIFGSLGHWRWLTKDNPTNVFIALVVDTHRTDNNLLLVRAAAIGAGLWVVALTAAGAAVFSRREAR